MDSTRDKAGMIPPGQVHELIACHHRVEAGKPGDHRNQQESRINPV